MKTKESNNNELIVLAPVIQRYTFAKRFSGENAREVYDAVIGRISKDFKNAPAFNGYFKFNEETQEINGSDLYHGILINDELRASGLHLPSVVEGKSLAAAKKLTKGFYRDYGIAVFNSESPNLKLAQRLVKEASMRSLEFPLLAPFSALKLGKDTTSKNKVSVFLRGGIPGGIITGQEAQKYLDEHFGFKGGSGGRRLFRDSLGVWIAGQDDLDRSNDDGRVDWICGEATSQNLERAVLGEINKASKNEMEKLNIKIAKSKEAALKILRS